MFCRGGFVQVAADTLLELSEPLVAGGPPTTTPAACSIGLIAEVKSDSGPSLVQHQFPQPRDGLGELR